MGLRAQTDEVVKSTKPFQTMTEPREISYWRKWRDLELLLCGLWSLPWSSVDSMSLRTAERRKLIRNVVANGVVPLPNFTYRVTHLVGENLPVDSVPTVPAAGGPLL